MKPAQELRVGRVWRRLLQRAPRLAGLKRKSLEGTQGLRCEGHEVQTDAGPPRLVGPEVGGVESAQSPGRSRGVRSNRRAGPAQQPMGGRGRALGAEAGGRVPDPAARSQALAGGAAMTALNPGEAAEARR